MERLVNKKDAIWRLLSEADKNKNRAQYKVALATVKELQDMYGEDNLNTVQISNYDEVCHRLSKTTNWDKIYLFNACDDEQVSKLRAINMLINTAKALNDGWQPDWNNATEKKWAFRINNNKFEIYSCGTISRSIVYFRTEELAKMAVDILGENIIATTLNNI